MNITNRKYTIDDLTLVPGVSTFETVAKRWGPKEQRELKTYNVYVGEVLIGVVSQHLPTFERKPEGSRIVTSRWKTAHSRWIYTSPFEKRGDHFRRNTYRDFHETRKRCLEEVVRHYNDRGEE